MKKVEEELKILEFEKRFLNSKFDSIYNKKWKSSQIVLYLLGLCTTYIVSGVLFYDEFKLLVWFFSVIYAVGIPATALGIDYNKEEKLIREIRKIDMRIDELNSILEKNIEHTNESLKNKNSTKEIKSNFVKKSKDFTNSFNNELVCSASKKRYEKFLE